MLRNMMAIAVCLLGLVPFYGGIQLINLMAQTYGWPGGLAGGFVTSGVVGVVILAARACMRRTSPTGR